MSTNRTNVSPIAQNSVARPRAMELYHIMRTIRSIDERSAELVSQGLAFFHLACAGHEAMGALAAHLQPTDWLHLHYRDKALLFARGVPIVDFFRSLLCRSDSSSAGRHLAEFHSSSRLHVVSQVVPVANRALQAVGIAAAIKAKADLPIVVCSAGDGSTQEGEFYEAIAEAVRRRLPVLFVVEDNGYSISTPTRRQTFFDLPDRSAEEFLGLPLHRADGCDVLHADEVFRDAVKTVRESRGPSIVILRADRLSSHSHADDQSVYRSVSDLEFAKESSDPLARLELALWPEGVDKRLLQDIAEEVDQAAREAIASPPPTAEFSAKRPLSAEYLSRPEISGGSDASGLSMSQALNVALRHHLEADPRVLLYGQDIEDPKGDIFGVTRGLSTAFPDRVSNAPLSEATILGTSIGRALTGQRPIAFIQFADFLPVAFNQILTELATIEWRSNGEWSCPVIVMASCGGYRAGLGPFHSECYESVLAHSPGLDVVMPSTAADAVGLLNAAMLSNRPTVFLYPKSCLNRIERIASTSVPEQFIPAGKARRIKSGKDLTIVTWGNPVAQCTLVAEALESAGVFVDLLDLRSISPWDVDAVRGSAESTGRLLVVHEESKTCGFGAEILATIAETASRPVTVKRVCRPDTYVPCHFGTQLQILPSTRTILEACAEILDLDVEWRTEQSDEEGIYTIRAFGSSAADDILRIVSLPIKLGDTIAEGQCIAEVETSKATFEISSPCSGTIDDICVEVEQQVKIGDPLVRLALPAGAVTAAIDPIRNQVPQITRRRQSASVSVATTHACPPSVRRPVVFITKPACVSGSRSVSNDELVASTTDWTPANVVQRTGVASRHWINSDESAVTLAVRAARQLMSRRQPNWPRIDAILCSTTVPSDASPSIACRVASALASTGALDESCSAVDFNAACSGYLYGLRMAFDLIHAVTSGASTAAVLLITSEVPSPVLNPQDPTTVFLFGDSATATLVSAIPAEARSLECHRPLCEAMADSDVAIRVPCASSSDYMTMDGIAVARAAYKAMADVMRRAAFTSNIAVEELTALVPHPGSARILKNAAEAMGIERSKVFTTLETTGNTSSSSIPQALHEFWELLPIDGPIGMTAFGAGFTAAAGVGRFEGV